MAAYLNRISTAVPGNDVHEPFVEFAQTLLTDRRSQLLFRRMAERSQLEHRFSTVEPRPLGSNATLDTDDNNNHNTNTNTTQHKQHNKTKTPNKTQKTTHKQKQNNKKKEGIT